MADSRELEQFDRFEATFKPQRLNDLKPEAWDWAGQRLTWEACWVIEDGRYEGQWACAPIGHYDGSEPRPDFAWAPDGDLVQHAEGEQ